MSKYETFSEVKRTLAFRLGYNSLNQAGTQTETAIGEAVNQALRHLHQVTENSFLRSHKVYATRTKETGASGAATGATVNAGSTSVSFGASTTVSSAWVGRDIVFASENVFYSIVGATAGAGGSITIFPAYEDNDNASAVAWAIYDAHLQMPDDFEDVISVVNLEDNYALKGMELVEAYRRVPNPVVNENSQPTRYVLDDRLELASPGSTATVKPWRMMLWPFPDSEVKILVRYWKMPTELSADGDVPDIPASHRQTLIELSWQIIGSTWGGKDPASMRMSQQMVAMGLRGLMRKQINRGAKLVLGDYREFPPLPGTTDIPNVDPYSNQWGNTPYGV